MPDSLDEREWQLLLDRIADGKCAPLLGPGLSAGIIPRRSEIVKSWAHQYEYPLADSANLAQVAQYLAVPYDPLYPREKINKQLAEVERPDFDAEEQPHTILASASSDSLVRLWDMRNLSLPPIIMRGHGDFVYSLDYGPHGLGLVSGGSDATVRIWEVRTLFEPE